MPSSKVAVLNSGRGSRPGFSSSARMSVTVGMPKCSSANVWVKRSQKALSPMIALTGFFVVSAMRSTTL